MFYIIKECHRQEIRASNATTKDIHQIHKGFLIDTLCIHKRYSLDYDRLPVGQGRAGQGRIIVTSIDIGCVSGGKGTNSPLVHVDE